jgi:uncharacterized 2Fe-2S/4Fe-4S cluster protein (DUF4445 family)
VDGGADRRRAIPEQYTITILPQGVVVDAPKGALLQDVLTQAGVDLALPCGGQGRCGRCLVVVREGQVRRRAVARLTDGEVAQGYALACQTFVEGDVTLFVPPQDRVLARAETTGAEADAATRAAHEVAACDHDVQPWVNKYHLVMDAPSLDDNTTDLERVQRELARQHGLRGVRAELPLLIKLAGALRASGSDAWDVTAVVEHGTWQDEAALRLIDVLPGDATRRTLAVAVDIGTTTNVVYLADLATREVLGRASAYNGQITCGEDIISRIIYCRREGGLARLQSLVVETLNGLLDQLLDEHGASPEELYTITVAGNPTMIHLFLGLDPAAIRLEPYIPTVNSPPPVRGRDLGLHIHPDATVDCLPGVGAYVGADITAGVLRAGLHESEAITLFIDVGTNGEIVLGSADWLISCACSAGPAFEGAGVESGMRAAPGAIEEVWIDPHTAEPTWRAIANEPPRGICGSGMISLLGEMFITGVMDKSGRLNTALADDEPDTRVRDGEHGPEYVVAQASETAPDVGDVVITEVDIQNLLRAKGAIYAGVSVLANSVGLTLDMIERVLIGGAFGQYIDIEKAIDIGMLPDMPWERFEYLGNTSVQGAYLCLQCREHRARIAEVASMMTYLELSADNSFMNEFTSALFLPHTDMNAFPSVQAKLAD